VLKIGLCVAVAGAKIIGRLRFVLSAVMAGLGPAIHEFAGNGPPLS
jgi:hypothetical protein